MLIAELIIKMFLAISNLTPSTDLSPGPTSKSLLMGVGR